MLLSTTNVSVVIPHCELRDLCLWMNFGSEIIILFQITIGLLVNSLYYPCRSLLSVYNLNITPLNMCTYRGEGGASRQLKAFCTIPVNLSNYMSTKYSVNFLFGPSKYFPILIWPISVDIIAKRWRKMYTVIAVLIFKRVYTNPYREMTTLESPLRDAEVVYTSIRLSITTRDVR